jgi:hypothetical protein
VIAEEQVSNAGSRIEQEVGDDERPGSPGLREDPPEQKAHGEVRRETSPTLIEVIGRT